MVLAGESLRKNGVILPNYSLSRMALELGLSVPEQLHDAYADSELAMRIYDEIKILNNTL